MTAAPSLPERAALLRELNAQWANTTANERSVFQSWLIRFCEALGVTPPVPPTDDYRFELPVRAIDREGKESPNYIDLWKRGHFAMEAKAFGENGDAERGLRRAYGQLRNYIAHVPGDPPPFLMVVDVPRTLIVWDRWSGAYGDFAAGRRISLATLPDREDDIALLCDVFEQPAARDPRGKAQAVTKVIAERLAHLAATLEDRGFDTERVSRFLMRCVFSCFAEDVGLLPPGLFRQTLDRARSSGDPAHLQLALDSLWKTMDTGGMYGAELLRRFNGHFFKTVEALPLEPDDVRVLIEAADHDWSRVEPSIFGTLLVRALDPEERHRLGAEYTPREYIERLVEPTVVEPIRERWTAVQAAVLQLEEKQHEADLRKADEPKVYGRGVRKKKGGVPSPIADAIQQLLDFHAWMRGLSFLDPACGSGNFLYVTMAAVKRIELEVLAEIDRLSHHQQGLVLEEVHPRQFHGIEVKPWAREIAELTLWIGYHQFWRDAHGGRTPPDPVLEDTGTIECRDAVLAWDAIVHRPEKDRPDPTPRIRHHVTGELVPDPEAKLPYFEYVGARQAEWPRADFIIGNPPYLGQARQREALGDGYVDALRAAYTELDDASDLVLYWWYRAAERVWSNLTMRSGLITTNSIAQVQNRRVLERTMARGARVIWAIANHPWVDSVDGAAVRVAMTVQASGVPSATIFTVANSGLIMSSRHVNEVHPDLSGGADISSAVKVPLLSNHGLGHDGVKLHGKGFLVEEDLAARMKSEAGVVRPYLTGRELAQSPRGRFAIDFGLMEEAQARAYPQAYDLIRARVKPQRDANKREIYRRYWWRFGEPRRELRDALASLGRFIGTVDTARHRFFMFLPSAVLVDDTVVCVASDDAFVLGVLSSHSHVLWADACGGRMGVGDDLRYNKSVTFDPFPFPAPNDQLRAEIADLAERLDAHRKAAIARDERVTMTGMYNVVEKLRSGEPLAAKERAIHEIAACGVLRDLHDELDAKVAAAYGWPWPMEREEILERLVALHDERVEEEKRGLVRWLRPEYQVPKFGGGTAAPAQSALTLTATEPAAVPAAAQLPWPDTAVAQLSAIVSLVTAAPRTIGDVVASFSGARADLVKRHLETLALMGEVIADGSGHFRLARKAA